MTVEAQLFDLSGEVGIVTGAGRGLGKAISVGLASYGADVADVVIEASGVIEEVRRSSRLARLGGRIGVVGIYENVVDGFDMSEIVLRDQTLHGTLASPRVFPRTLKEGNYGCYGDLARAETTPG